MFKQPIGQGKDGKEFGGNYKLQILGSVDLQNGETKNQLIDLTCHDINDFEPYRGQVISFPVGVVAMGKNQTVFSYRREPNPSLAVG